MTDEGVAISTHWIGFHNWVPFRLSLRCKLRLVLKLSCGRLGAHIWWSEGPKCKPQCCMLRGANFNWFELKLVSHQNRRACRCEHAASWCCVFGFTPSKNAMSRSSVLHVWCESSHWQAWFHFYTQRCSMQEAACCMKKHWKSFLYATRGFSRLVAGVKMPWRWDFCKKWQPSTRRSHTTRGEKSHRIKPPPPAGICKSHQQTKATSRLVLKSQSHRFKAFSHQGRRTRCVYAMISSVLTHRTQHLTSSVFASISDNMQSMGYFHTKNMASTSGIFACMPCVKVKTLRLDVASSRVHARLR